MPFFSRLQFTKRILTAGLCCITICQLSSQLHAAEPNSPFGHSIRIPAPGPAPRSVNYQSGSKEPYEEETESKKEQDQAREENLTPIDQLKIGIKIDGNVPENLAQKRFSAENSVTHGMGISRNWKPAMTAFSDRGLCYQPLYLEDPPLERCGKDTRKFQPVVSGIKFYGDTLLLPVQMLKQRPNTLKCTHPLEGCENCR